MNSQHSIKSGSESLRQASMKWSPTSESLMRSSSLVSRKLQVGVPHDDLLAGSSHDLGYVLNHGYRNSLRVGVVNHGISGCPLRVGRAVLTETERKLR